MTDLDGVYYGQGLPPLADGDFGLTTGTVAAVISDIYDEQVGYGDLHPGLYAETKRIFDEAVDTGVESAVAGGADMPSDGFMGRLHDNAGVFAAFRTHAMQRDMVRLLTDNTGRLKSFAAFRKDAEQYASHRNRAWLKTEYDTAVNRAHFAARWRQFEEEKDVLPNLEWLPSTSPNPGADHRAFWGTVRPVDDAFWNEHRPGDRWNCKCELAATDKPATKVPYDGDPKNKPSKGLKTNPGKKGEIFDKEHSYYPASCSACPFAKNKLMALFHDLADRRNCESCKALARVVRDVEINAKKKEWPPRYEDYDEVSKDVHVSSWHGKNELRDNLRVGRFISNKIKDKVWLLPRLDPKNVRQAELRSKLLPRGVYEGKNPDFLIQGKLFEGKSLLDIKEFNRDYVHNAIFNRIKKAKKQAKNVILEIPAMVDRRYINSAIESYFTTSSKDREIWIIWKNKLLKYKKR